MPGPVTSLDVSADGSMIVWTTPAFVFFTCPSEGNWEKGGKAPKPLVLTLSISAADEANEALSKAMLKEGGEDAFASFKRGRKGNGAAAGAGAPGAKKGGAAKDKKNARPGKSARAKKR